jgi:hypothetical protein
MKNRKKESLLQMFFLRNDVSQNVEMQEVYEIDMEEIKRRLENGESVYIKQKGQKSDGKFIAYKREKEPWYLVHS